MNFENAILNPPEDHARRMGLIALWRAVASDPSALTPELSSFVSERKSYDIEEAAVLGLILFEAGRAYGAEPSLGVLARILPMIDGGLDAELRAAARSVFADRSARETFDALYEAIADDSLSGLDEHYALWATRTVDQDKLS